MTGIRLEFYDPKDHEQVSDYIRDHVAPVATELHRITNELLSPGSTSAEEWSMDMVSSAPIHDGFSRLDRRLDESPKHVAFDGSEYFSLPKELLRAKQVKIQFTAAVYVKGHGTAAFRLVCDGGALIKDSEFTTDSPILFTKTCRLPFGDQRGCIQPDRRTYYIEACRTKGRGIPVCRRLSLSFVYI
jgi:hypothetical protein